MTLAAMESKILDQHKDQGQGLFEAVDTEIAGECELDENTIATESIKIKPYVLDQLQFLQQATSDVEGSYIEGLFFALLFS